VSFYPTKIAEIFKLPKNAGTLNGANAFGTGASFLCGAFVRLSLCIYKEKRITEAKFQTNGCGYMIAAANVLCGHLADRRLTKLHGLTQDEPHVRITDEIGEFPEGRKQCLELVIEALKNALSDFRSRTLEEFQGEKALICTCFGVSEETILSVIDLYKPNDVCDISEICNAGLGCGSCQMIIQEMLDAAESELEL